MDFDLSWDSKFDPDNAQETFESMLSETDDRLVSRMTQAGQRIEKGASQRSRVDTGNMKASWSSELLSRRRTITVEVGNETRYAVYHEYGTQDIAPSPMLRPALDQEVQDLTRDIRLLVLKVAEMEGSA